MIEDMLSCENFVGGPIEGLVLVTQLDDHFLFFLSFFLSFVGGLFHHLLDLKGGFHLFHHPDTTQTTLNHLLLFSVCLISL